MIDPFNYKRRESSVVYIGDTPMGYGYPIRLQSMTNTSTMDTEASVRQAARIIEAGGEYVRLTAQGVREAENLKLIRDELTGQGYTTPLIADIHFNPRAADTAARMVEKVRINPGNFVDPVKTFQTFEYSEEEYGRELEKIRSRFVPFLNICKAHHTAIRIGVNHGSLSDRIMSRFGDTPEGMVESCMEFLRICVEEAFTDVVLSIKASSSSVMVRTVRLLVDRMEREGMSFPLHLGVTEAGDGEDGRIKSAIGIGALLMDGIGDTIRVSLSEEPEQEIPVARLLRDYVAEREGQPLIPDKPYNGFASSDAHKYLTKPVAGIGGDHLPVVIADYSGGLIPLTDPDRTPDLVYTGKWEYDSFPESLPRIMDFRLFSPGKNRFPLFTADEQEEWLNCTISLQFIALQYKDLNDEILSGLRKKPQTVVLLSGTSRNRIGEQRAAVHRLRSESLKNPVILQGIYNEKDPQAFRIKAAADTGSFFLDWLADGIFLQNKGDTLSPGELISCAFGILQGCGRRITQTEYISCPGCGRTLFDLQSAVRKIKGATAHLKGLKIGIMGCIVNGPGEMADADYGYVGAGAGKISLYKGKECVKKNIPEENAVEELLNLIKKGRK